MNNLNRKLNDLRKSNPDFAKLLDELLNYKEGQGDYTIDRYDLPDPEIDTIIQQIRKMHKDKIDIEKSLKEN